MLEINESKLKLKLFGQEFEIPEPTVKQIKALSLDVKKDQTQEEAANALQMKLQEMGLPLELTDRMTPSQLEQLVDYLFSLKKS